MNRLIDCDCGLTSGCEKCNPFNLRNNSGDNPADIAVNISTDNRVATLPLETLRLIYFRVMAVAKAKAKDDRGIYGELVDAVFPLRGIVTDFGWGSQEDG